MCESVRNFADISVEPAFIDGSCWSISSLHVNCIKYRVNGFHNKCKWLFPRYLPHPHNGNRFPRIANNDETDGLLRTLINVERNTYWILIDCSSWILLILDGLNMRPRWYKLSVSEKMNISDYYEDGTDGEEDIPQWILYLSFLVWALLPQSIIQN